MMRQGTAASLTLVIVLACMFCAPVSGSAEKLKGFYSGSGGFSQEVHRTLLVEFAKDGSVILQQNWEGKDPQVWHGQWTQDGKDVKVIFNAAKDQPALDPLVMKVKHGSLVATSWDAKALGVLGPPTLTPFGGKNIPRNTVAGCVALNSVDPSKSCTTWDSRDPK